MKLSDLPHLQGSVMGYNTTYYMVWYGMVIPKQLDQVIPPKIPPIDTDNYNATNNFNEPPRQSDNMPKENIILGSCISSRETHFPSKKSMFVTM